MGLNFPPPDNNLEGIIPPHSMIGCIHPVTHHEIVVEQPKEGHRIPDRMPDWLAQLITKNNPH